MNNSHEQLTHMRHSAAHLLAVALQKLYPSTQFAIGPVIEHGFYYDIDLDQKLTPDDLPRIEKEMNRIKKQGFTITGNEVTVAQAKELFKKLKQPYKLELIAELEKAGEKISTYTLNDFVDLCRGGHVHSQKDMGVFKLTTIAGAYWRGSEKNKMLQRIYGLAFPTQEELDAHITMEEEAKKRDHRILGQELDLFSFHDEGPGFPFWHPKGNFVRTTVIQYLRDVLAKEDYQEIYTPLILSEELWHKSGHWDHYKENMYFTTVDERIFAVKPMNCPGAALVYSNHIRSYRELPLRLSEFGIVHRHELSGTLHGLFRVRNFTQDDAHLFCTPDQIAVEISKLVKLSQKVYKTFGFKDYRVELSTRPEKFMGDISLWDHAEKTLSSVLAKLKIPTTINEGDGAFYGPKIDFHIKDAIGRSWQCGTIQLDFQMPKKFDLSYIDKKGNKEQPVMIHRAIFGSVERFIGILIENYAGAFPVWLAPTQVSIISVNETHKKSVLTLAKLLKEQGIRVETELSDTTVGYKIRASETQKIPYTIVIGDKEKNLTKVALRTRGSRTIETTTPKKFIERIKKESALK